MLSSIFFYKTVWKRFSVILKFMPYPMNFWNYFFLLLFFPVFFLLFISLIPTLQNDHGKQKANSLIRIDRPLPFSSVLALTWLIRDLNNKYHGSVRLRCLWTKQILLYVTRLNCISKRKQQNFNLNLFLFFFNPLLKKLSFGISLDRNIRHGYCRYSSLRIHEVFRIWRHVVVIFQVK